MSDKEATALEKWALIQIGTDAPVGKERLEPLVQWLGTDAGRAAYEVIGKHAEESLGSSRREIRLALQKSQDSGLAKLERELDDLQLRDALIVAKREIIIQSLARHTAFLLRNETEHRNHFLNAVDHAGYRLNKLVDFLDVEEKFYPDRIDDAYSNELRDKISDLNEMLNLAPDAWRADPRKSIAPRAGEDLRNTQLWDHYTTPPEAFVVDSDEEKERKRALALLTQATQLLEGARKEFSPKRGRPPADPLESDLHAELVKLGASDEQAWRALGLTPKAGAERRRRSPPQESDKRTEALEKVADAQRILTEVIAARKP